VQLTNSVTWSKDTTKPVNRKSHIPHVLYITNHEINEPFMFKHVLLPVLGVDGFGHRFTWQALLCHMP
jgi:hypothetical protein